MKANLRYTTHLITGNITPTPTYMTWKAMRQRCRDKKAWNYKYYGGRGISYDQRWDDFMLFLQDMGERPPGMTLDRENADKNYCKENCRWATVDVQHDHMRPRHDRITPLINGAERTLQECAIISGLSIAVIRGRWCKGLRGDDLLKPKKWSPRHITISGVTRRLSDWAKLSGISRGTIRKRVDLNLPEDQLLSTRRLCGMAVKTVDGTVLDTYEITKEN